MPASEAAVPIYAHRFGSAYGPESSRQALEGALAHGVEGLESDVVLTRDDRVLALHDPSLSYSTDLSGWAHEHDSAQLLDAHIVGGAGESSDQHPMALEEVLEIIPDQIPYQLDVKAYADHGLARRTAERACEIVRAHGTGERAELISFFTVGCEAAVEQGVDARLVAWADYAPAALVEWVKSRGIAGMSLEGFILSEELAATIHDAGLTISAGAVNTPDQGRRMLELGVEILVSDRPHELRDELAGS
ncbi:MAG TPA: glycerophosphodiester phosphodiesterase [Solirubrobacterales bacterium]|nr:glycerophosphodiester phosphodiesterase [Solirubrobacterales bacterium]